MKMLSTLSDGTIAKIKQMESWSFEKVLRHIVKSDLRERREFYADELRARIDGLWPRSRIAKAMKEGAP